ncbi:MAG: esterase/lipase family protein [Burkholderiales bacterium]
MHPPAQEVVILVHGLWMNGMDMGLLRRRLARAGFRPVQFRYPSLRRPPHINAMQLHTFAQGLDAQTLHFVGHSLGGIVIRHLFFEYPDQRPGRVVTLGTPHHFSQAAGVLSRWPIGRLLLGKSTKNGLLGHAPPWPNGRELGSIAGSLGLGMGMLIPGIPSPNDGTVAVDETRLPGMRDHRIFRVSHFGMLLSATVAGQIASFLKDGHFAS